MDYYARNGWVRVCKCRLGIIVAWEYDEVFAIHVNISYIPEVDLFKMPRHSC